MLMTDGPKVRGLKTLFIGILTGFFGFVLAFFGDQIAVGQQVIVAGWIIAICGLIWHFAIMAGLLPAGDDSATSKKDELKQAGIDVHEVKTRLGQVSLFEICKCKSGGFAVKRKGCKGPIIFRL
jgi:hypothetical protein